MPTGSCPRIDYEVHRSVKSPCGYAKLENGKLAYYETSRLYRENDHVDNGRGDISWNTQIDQVWEKSFDTTDTSCDTTQIVNTNIGTELYCTIPRVAIPNGLPPTSTSSVTVGEAGDPTITETYISQWDLGDHVYTKTRIDELGQLIPNTAQRMLTDLNAWAAVATPTLTANNSSSINTTLARARFTIFDDVNTLADGIYYLRTKYRLSVPPDIESGYYKVTWDVLREITKTAVGGAETVEKKWHQRDQTWEWVAAVDGLHDPNDPETGVSPWMNLEPVLADTNIPSGYAEVKYEYRIVNVRFEHFRSTKLGSKPDVCGEAVGDDEITP